MEMINEFNDFDFRLLRFNDQRPGVTLMTLIFVFFWDELIRTRWYSRHGRACENWQTLHRILISELMRQWNVNWRRLFWRAPALATPFHSNESGAPCTRDKAKFEWTLHPPVICLRMLLWQEECDSAGHVIMDEQQVFISSVLAVIWADDDTLKSQLTFPHAKPSEMQEATAGVQQK